MNPEIKTRWLEALLSGKYQQGAGYLRSQDALTETADSYCCLGVLCELAVEDGIIESGRDGGHSAFWYGDKPSEFPGGGTWSKHYLPDAVSEWADIDGLGNLAKPGKSLADLNDTGSTFEEIAAVIEAEL